MKLHQSGNKIIVTELNPMSEAPIGEYVLACFRPFDKEMVIAKRSASDFMCFRFSEVSYDIGFFEGWLPMPVYEPSAKSPEERYEKLRKLNAAQFAELYERNLRGENFDEMVDAL